MNQELNQQRAEYARTVLMAFARATNTQEEGVFDTFYALVEALQHLAEHLSINFAEISEEAQRIYEDATGIPD